VTSRPPNASCALVSRSWSPSARPGTRRRCWPRFSTNGSSLEEAARFAEIAGAEAAEDNIAAQVVLRGVRAKLERSADLAREAVALADRTDATNLRADALLNLFETLQLVDAQEEASDALRRAIALYDEKGNLVASSRALRATAA
jgi:hypothetical protein